MNKSFLKFITDFGPLLIFFTIYYKSGNNLSVAIPPLIIATILAVIAVYFIENKIPYVPLIGGIIISLFGGLTLYFDNPIFLYIKPTIVNVIFAITLISGKVLRILKNLKTSYFNEKFLIKDKNGNILKKSENLNNLINKINWNNLRLVK